MPDTKVMVVDDSAAMRALFCGILENAKGVDVCGVASDADEARAKMEECRPDVLTLDVEMPGMSGMDFLAEIMEHRPMPVIMLSSIAQAGSGVAQKAMELGAVHCFPKPLHSSQEEFDATVRKLGDIVVRAHNGELGGKEKAAKPCAAPHAAAPEPHEGYEPDGSLVVLAGGAAGLEGAMQVVASLPAACPPTILLVDADRPVVEAALAGVEGQASCNVCEASDGLALTPGTVAVVFERMHHVIVEPGTPPKLRNAVRDPVGGIRPCADLLLASIARARVAASAGLLAGTGADGAKGLQLLAQSGGKVFVAAPPDGAPRERLAAVQALGIGASELEQDAVAGWILEHTAKG